MSDIENALKQIESKRRQLVQVEDPTEIFKGMVEIDHEMHKLAKNLKILAELEYLAGNEKVRLEQVYNRKTMEMARQLNESELKKLGVVKSNKFKYISSALNQERADVDVMALKYKYFRDIRDTYIEWVNIYKKTRTVAE